MTGKRTTLLALAVVLLVLVAVAVLYQLSSGPNVSQFAHLRELRFTRIADQRVLIVEAIGDPNVVAAPAFDALFKAYYRLEGVSRMQRPLAPRARWSHLADTPKDKWKGQYALPVPNSVTAVRAEGVTVGTWTYGDVAEVLHVGPYSAEQPNIERLREFVASKGYRVIGEHEEEYVKGPGMVFAGNPNDYLTIIGLRAKKLP